MGRTTGHMAMDVRLVVQELRWSVTENVHANQNLVNAQSMKPKKFVFNFALWICIYSSNPGSTHQSAELMGKPMKTDVWQIVPMLMQCVKENAHANQNLVNAQCMKPYLIMYFFTLHCGFVIILPI